MIVKPTKYKVPELEIDQPVELAVAVPDDGENLLVEAMVKAPLKEKSPVGWAEGVSLIVKPTKFKVPELASDQPVELAVTVPEDGGNLLVEAMVSAPENEKLPLG